MEINVQKFVQVKVIILQIQLHMYAKKKNVQIEYLIQQQIIFVESLHAFLMRMIIINVHINVQSLFYMNLQNLKEYVFLNPHVHEQ
jgi:hypothetical protein